MQGTFRPGRRHSDGRAIDRTRSRSPGSRNPAHIRENLEILDFSLTDGDMERIRSLDCGKRYFNMPYEEQRSFLGWEVGD